MNNYWFPIFSFLMINFSLLADQKNLHFNREDGSIMEAYFDHPETDIEGPIVVFIDGSFDTHVKANHDQLATRFIPRNIGLITIEKRGIKANKIDQNEFRAHDCFEERLQDYYLLLKHIEEGNISGCKGPIILLGLSEGGKIAPRLSLNFSHIVQGVVLIASGGGLTFAEEMKFQSDQMIQQMSALKRLSYRLRGSLFPNELDQLYDKMLKKPDSLEMYGPKTWKWFASYLRYDLLSDLLKIEVPIYMIHGEKDVLVPIKSADLVDEAFYKAGKTNLHYARYIDLGHSITPRECEPMLDWICEKTQILRNLE